MFHGVIVQGFFLDLPRSFSRVFCRVHSPADANFSGLEAELKYVQRGFLVVPNSEG